MSTDKETLDVYDKKAADYAAMTLREETPGLTEFLAAVPPAGHVLDLGCGPGHVARAIQATGRTVDAMDASHAMVKLARAEGVPARQASFDEIKEHDIYDGIWANFSLLHAPRAAFPAHLQALSKALRAGGILHLGMKLGDGEARDALGRFYTYYSEEALLQHLTTAGFTPATTFRGKGPGLDGLTSPWIWIHAHG